MMRRRSVLAAALALPGLARAQGAGEFPSRAVRVVVPYAPGGASDIVGRILAQHASTTTGQNFVIENRSGGASVPGTQLVATAPPDGYTIGTADNALSVNPGILRERLPYDTERELAPLGLAVVAPVVLVANAAAPARSVADLLAAARARPGAITLAHAGIGSPNHLAAVQFQIATGLEMTLVGYRGGGPEVAALVGGEIAYGFVAAPSVLEQIRAGRVRALALTSSTRSAFLPEVPTFIETGLPAVDNMGWWGLIAPAGVPEPLLDRLHDILLGAAHEPAVKARLEALNYTVVGGSRAEFGALIHREIARWREVFSRPGVAVE